MTRIVYQSHGQTKEDEAEGYFMWYFQIWAEIVPGGEEELAKRKAEIQAKHELGCQCCGQKPWPVRYFYEIRDYLEFEI